MTSEGGHSREISPPNFDRSAGSEAEIMCGVLWLAISMTLYQRVTSLIQRKLLLPIRILNPGGLSSFIQYTVF